MTPAAGRLVRRVRDRAVSLDRLLSRRLLGSGAGTYRFVAGARAVRAAASACRYARDQSWTLGFKALGQPYPPALIEEIAAEFGRLIEIEGAYYRRGDQNRIYRQIGREFTRLLRSPAQQIPLLNELISDGLAAALHAYFGAEFRPTQISAWRNYHAPPEYARRGILSNYWHNDTFRTDIVKVYVALQDVCEEDGPFHFVPRPQTAAALTRHGYEFSWADVPEGIPPADVHRFTGPIGSTLMINTTHCLHKAGVPAPGRQRDLLELRFQVSPTPVARVWPDESGQPPPRPVRHARRR